jgi:alkylation response protein AidB-like acyl-CoA dehydrogenase
MDFELSKELLELQEAARHFVEQELVPHELYVDEHESIPEDVLKRIRAKAIDYGLWPMNVPVEMGGLGSSVMAQVVAQEQAGRATNGLWAHVGGPYNALMRCDEAQRRKYLEPALRGEWTVSYAVSEPGGGSDTTNLKTTAEKKGDRWVINGEKWFVSGGNDGIGLLVHAVTGPDEETLFLVDHDTPGMRLSRTPRFMHRHRSARNGSARSACTSQPAASERPSGSSRRPRPGVRSASRSAASSTSTRPSAGCWPTPPPSSTRRGS